MTDKTTSMRDLGLSYTEAGHGVQSAIRFEMSQKGFADDEQDKIVGMLKHLRVGLDLRAADAGGLALLLIAKGVFTQAEYVEQMRLAANEELARYQEHCREVYGLPDGTDFR
jgi:hypothetical protein